MTGVTLQGPALILSEDDVDDLNKALSLSYVGAIVQENGDGDTGVHLASLCESIAHHLCNIRNRHRPEGAHSVSFVVGGGQ